MIKSKMLSERGHIPFYISDGQFRIVFRTKHEDDWSGLIPVNMPKQMLAQFRREGYEPVFSAFPVDLHNKVVQVYVFRFEGKKLGNTKAGIADGKRYKPGTPKITFARVRRMAKKTRNFTARESR